jgi:hypothetical protein
MKADVLEERLCVQPLPETSSTAQDAFVTKAEQEQEQAIEEAGAGAMEACTITCMDDDNVLPFALSRVCNNAEDEDLDVTPLSFEQLDRVLRRLEKSDQASWSPSNKRGAWRRATASTSSNSS